MARALFSWAQIGGGCGILGCQQQQKEDKMDCSAKCFDATKENTNDAEFWTGWGREGHQTLVEYSDGLSRSYLGASPRGSDYAVFIGKVDRLLFSDRILAKIRACPTKEERQKFVATVVRNKCLDIVRSAEWQNRDNSYPSDRYGGENDGMGSGTALIERRSASPQAETETGTCDYILVLKDSLDDKDFRVLELRYLKNQTNKEIAAKEGTHRNTVSKRLKSALERARSILHELGIQEDGSQSGVDSGGKPGSNKDEHPGGGRVGG